MEFWKWYFRGIRRGILNLPRALISPSGEYILGFILLVVSSIVLSDVLSPFWLFLTIPVFTTITCHGYWRTQRGAPAVGRMVSPEKEKSLNF